MDSFIPNTTQEVDLSGPRNPVSIKVMKEKYMEPGEDWWSMTGRVAGALHDDEAHRKAYIRQTRALESVPGGRILTGAGSTRRVTLLNCYGSPKIEDSLCGPYSIMRVAELAAKTMQKGGGIGFNFSTLRPKGALIKSLGSESSGPISFMHIYDAVCGAISSAGGRRGAMMATMIVSHPDIEEFIGCKANTDKLRGFNISVLVTDAFIEAVKQGTSFDLSFQGIVYKTVDARALWDAIMRMTWKHAEPGVIFIDRMNQMNNLYYCEEITLTNPCAEIPLPYNGACLLGSLNLAKFVKWSGSRRYFDYEAFRAAIPVFYKALDNVVDVTDYPLPEQEAEEKAKRRIGMGTMGNANAIEACGHEYGSDGYIEMQNAIYDLMVNTVYQESAKRAAERGSFPLYDNEKFLDSKFVQSTLSEETKDCIEKNGIRNSHLTAIAPTGSISIYADNISSGIEPVFLHSYERDILGSGGRMDTVVVQDYGVSHFGVYGKTANEISAEDHVRVAAAAQRYMDASVSKTCNVGKHVSWADFKNLYMLAYDLGAKGITTYREGNREGVLREIKEGAACTIDPMTGQKTCS